MLAAARTAWYANGDQIARFLASANPNWPLATMQEMMRMHLDQTLAEATARLTHDWAGDIVTYDALVVHIVSMADALTAGVATQFPQLVSPSSSMAPFARALHLAMRTLWEQHVVWTRVFLIDTIAGLPDTSFATQRLLQNQVDIGNALRPYYGDAAGDRVTSLLHDHITGAAEVVAAAQSGDQPRLTIARTAWYANGDAIADFLASANVNWSQETLRAMMRMHLDMTLAEAVARLSHDWAGDVAAYDAVTVHILDMADSLSVGINAQFPDGPAPR